MAADPPERAPGEVGSVPDPERTSGGGRADSGERSAPRGAAVARGDLERQLKSSEARRRIGFEAAGIGDWRYDPDTGTLEVSRRTSKMHRLPPGRPISIDEHDARIHPDDRAAVRAAREAALRGEDGGRYRTEFRFVFDDEVRWFESHGQALLDPPGDDSAGPMLVGAMVDITDRKREAMELAEAKEELQATVARLERELENDRVLQRFSTELIPETGPQTLYERLLDAMIAVMRADAASVQELDPETEELALLAWRGLHPESARYWERVPCDSGSVCERALAVGERVVVRDVEPGDGADVHGYAAPAEDLEAFRRSGIRAVQSTPLVARSGAIIGMISTHWRMPHEPTADSLARFDVLARQAADLIERARTEQALREGERRQRTAAAAAEVERSRLDAVLQDLPVGVWITDMQGRLVEKNKAADAIWCGDALVAETMDAYARYTAYDVETGAELEPDTLPLARALAAAERIEPIELKIRRFDGTEGVVLSSAAPILDASGRLLGAVGITVDITERASIEAALRQSEEHQAFLLRLSDALRPLMDPADIQHEASRVLGEHLRANRVAYGETTGESGAYFDIRQEYRAEGMSSLIGRLRYDDYGAFVLDAFRAGRTLVVADVAETMDRHAGDRDAYERIEVGAFVAVPLVKEGRVVAFMSVTQRTARRWSPGDVALVEEVAERTWAALERARAEAALRESEQRFRALADLVPDLLWEDDANGKHVWANRRWTEYTGLSPQEAAGQGWAVVLHPEDRERVRRDYLAALEAAAPYRNEYRIRRADGTYRWHLVEAVPILDERGEVSHWLGASTDVHEERAWRDRLEELVDARTRSLAESEERYRALVLTTAHTVWSSDAEGKIFEDSPTWRAYTGQTYADYVGAGLRHAVHPEDREGMTKKWRRAVQTTKPYDVQLRLWHGPSGTWRWNHVRAVPLRDADGKVKGWFGTNTDVHDRLEAQNKLREMARRLTMAEQEERRRISQVLHDDLQQLLYAVEMKLDLARRRLRAGDIGAALPELDKGRVWIDRAVDTTRRLTVDLSPQILRDEGLVDAIGWLRTQMRTLHEMNVSLEAAHAWYIEDEDLRVLLFQVVRELLFNVHKHAGTSEARVRLVEKDGYLVIHVEDDGKGFEADRLVLKSNEQQGWGLVRAYERLTLLGGDLVVRSEPGRGTHIEVHAPVEARG